MLTASDDSAPNGEPGPLHADIEAAPAAAGPNISRAPASRSLQRAPSQPALAYVADGAQFGALVHQKLAECRRWSVPLAVLMMTVERMHLPHERHSAAIKAQMLHEAGQRLHSRVRHADTVVRVGRESFGLVLHDAAEATARNVEMRLAQALHMPYRIGSMLLQLSVISGFAVYPQGGATGEALVLSAGRTRDRPGEA